MGETVLLGEMVARILGWPTSQSEKQLSKLVPNPKEVFGVFVTLWRSSRKAHEDVHGCIGHWDLNPASRTREVLVQWLLDAAKKAAQQDPRSRETQQPLWRLPDMLIEISWMTTPHLVNGDQQGEREFDPITNGLLVESTLSNSRATFLPSVFPQGTWSSVKASLLQKAGLDFASSTTREEGVQFWIYRTLEQQNDFFASIFLDQQSYARTTLQPWRCGWWANAWSQVENPDQIPWGYSQQNLVVHPRDQVRNMGVLFDTVSAWKETADCLPDSEQRTIRHLIRNWLDRRDSLSFQAWSFLLRSARLTLDRSGELEGEVRDMESRLVSLINDPNQVSRMDLDFELPEILLSLTVPQIRSSLGWRTLQTHSPDNLFGLNWFAQVCAHLGDLSHLSFLSSAWTRQLFSSSSLSAMETNLLVVSLEGLAATLYLLTLSRSGDQDEFSQFSAQARSQLLATCHLLLTQRLPDPQGQGFLSFKDLSTKRFDLTGHFFSGLSWLQSN